MHSAAFWILIILFDDKMWTRKFSAFLSYCNFLNLVKFNSQPGLLQALSLDCFYIQLFFNWFLFCHISFLGLLLSVVFQFVPWNFAFVCNKYSDYWCKIQFEVVMTARLVVLSLDVPLCMCMCWYFKWYLEEILLLSVFCTFQSASESLLDSHVYMSLSI